MGTDKQAVKDTRNMGHISANLDVATLKKGTKYRYMGYIYHVLGKYDDNGTTLIIAKYFGKYMERWHYDIIEADCFEELVAKGLITKNK